LTPNIGLTLALKLLAVSTSWRTRIRIHAALDLCDSLLVAMNHANDDDYAAYQNGYDRDQQAA
jgi:hypothetical protein